MPIYESVIVGRQDITKNQFDKLIEEFSSIITEQKGTIKKLEYWGLKNLAYEINKNKKGHYCMLILETAPDTISEYERKMRIHEDVIRYMTIKVNKFEDKPSIMMQNANDNPNFKDK
tara:strand:+ start:708 stop:1058 length:351 start_codon:yes stop_codon:yes gene_type:complete